MSAQLTLNEATALLLAASVVQEQQVASGLSEPTLRELRCATAKLGLALIQLAKPVSPAKAAARAAPKPRPRKLPSAATRARPARPKRGTQRS